MIYGSGNLGNISANATLGTRPTFYLDSTEKYSEGSGTLEDPYILEQ